MSEIPVCAACLATDVRMYSMSSYSLLQPYQLLSGVQSNGMPQKLCWECAALVNKYNLFRHKCERAHLLLQEIYDRHEEITETNVKDVDRASHHLISSYTVSHQRNYLTLNHRPTRKARSSSKKERHKNQNNTEFIKLEPDVLKCEDLKSEDETEFDAQLLCSSDDENIVREKRTISESEETEKDDVKVKENDLNVTEVLVSPEQARAVYKHRRKSKKYLNSKYKCTHCFLAFKDQALYDKHVLKHSPATGAHQCDICKRRFKSKRVLGLHRDKHLKQFVCNICSKISHTKDIAKQHSALHETLGEVVRKRGKKNVKSRAKVTADDFEAEETILTQEQQMETVRERRTARGFSTARFKCLLCYKAFNEQKTYSNHALQHDPISGGLECDLCKLRYNTRLKIFKHITNNHLRRYACKLCPHVCYNRSFALNHYRWHKGVIYSCDICEAKFDKKTSYRSHLRIKHPSRHVCGRCGEHFVSASGLLQHANRMHSLKPDAATRAAEHANGPFCSECEVQFSTEQAWTRHILISPRHEHERDRITNGCQYCGEVFGAAAELKRHYVMQHRRHKRTFKVSPHKVFPAKCAQCEEVMSSAGKYWQHFRQEHPGKPFPLTGTSFICEYCGNWFKYQSALDAHKRTHLQKHQCPKCPKQFTKLASLASHAECHEGQFGCDVCSRQFAHRRSLTNHLRTHTSEKPHVCEWCGKTFAYDCNLKKHELTAHCPPPIPSSSHHNM